MSTTENASTPSLEIPDWPQAYGAAVCQGVLRQSAEDFRVDEVLGFAADGEGEHLLVQVQKRNLNTDQVARQLARHAGVRARDVSYCGLKDRVAVTTQWFSLWLPGKPDPDWSPILNDDLQVLAQARHRRKLPRGALEANQFTITLRQLVGDPQDIEQRLTQINDSGVPNYFGEQRFGRGGRNVASAQAMFGGVRIKDRHQRGLYLSAARSFLFNEVLASRIAQGSWQNLLPGEAVMLAGSRSFFQAEVIDDALLSRLASRDISPSGPLWGRGELPAQFDVRELETAALDTYSGLKEGLELAGLKQERRGLCLFADQLRWQWPDKNSLEMIFRLPAGAYATSVLREIMASPPGQV